MINSNKLKSLVRKFIEIKLYCSKMHIKKSVEAKSYSLELKTKRSFTQTKYSYNFQILFECYYAVRLIVGKRNGNRSNKKCDLFNIFLYIKSIRHRLMFYLYFKIPYI